MVRRIEAVTHRRNLPEGLRGSGSRTGDIDSSSLWDVTLPAQRGRSMSIAGSGPLRYWVLQHRPRGMSGVFPVPNRSLIALVIKLGSLSLPVPSSTDRIARGIA